MGKIQNIFLVRHGESAANTDMGIYKAKPDYAIPLTERGREQALKAGEYFAAYYKDLLSTTPALRGKPVRLWMSPYLRAQQTAEEFIRGAGGIAQSTSILTDMRESIHLREQDFGLHDGLSDEEGAERFPDFAEHRRISENSGHRFFSRYPNGESRADVYTRLDIFKGTLQRDAMREENPIENIVLIGHGLTMRAFTMCWMRYNYQWLEGETNPSNCAIRHLQAVCTIPHQSYLDRGYIYWRGEPCPSPTFVLSRRDPKPR